jgi:hypothetical protein
MREAGPKARYWGPVGMIVKDVQRGYRFGDDRGNVWTAGENIPAGLVVVDTQTSEIVGLTWERMGDLTQERPW